MKLAKKEWRKVIFVLLSVLLILYIYYLNGSKNENFQNKNEINFAGSTDMNDLKTSLAIFSKVRDERIDNIKIEGTLPNLKIRFDVLPRNLGDIEEESLAKIKDIMDAYKSNMDYNFNIDGQDQTFLDIDVVPYEHSQKTTFQGLTDKFVDRGIDTQIQSLKNIQNLVKYNNPMDRFYKFNNNTGGLTLEEEMKNNIPAEAEPVSGELNSDLANNSEPIQNAVESFVPYHKRFY